VLGASGDGVEDGQTVEGVVNIRVAGEDAQKLLSGFVVVSGVELGDGVVVVLFGRGEGEVVLLHLALAGDDVDPAALLDLHGGVGEKLLESGGGFLVFALLQELNGSLVLLEGRSGCRVGLCGRLGVGGRSFFAAGSRGSGLLRHGFAMSAYSGKKGSAGRPATKN